MPNFENLIMIDDDVPLPPGFNFHAGEATDGSSERSESTNAGMMDNDPMLASIGYAITAVTPTDPQTGKSEDNFLVGMQDVECQWQLRLCTRTNSLASCQPHTLSCQPRTSSCL